MSSETQTVSVLIGNSDNKLPQKRWAEFVLAASNSVELLAARVHFSGSSWPTSERQNACFVLEIRLEDLPGLRRDLEILVTRFGQDSIALVAGSTEFVMGRQ